jgi:dihydrolipoamide dehydrogenase
MEKNLNLIGMGGTPVFDFIIIGSGPGGLSIALLLAKNFYKTALLEKFYLGGTCLNIGCIPSKYLLNLVHLFKTIKYLHKNKIINFREVNLNLDRINYLKNKFIRKIRSGIKTVLNSRRIFLIKHDLKLDLKISDKSLCSVNLFGNLRNLTIETRRVILCCGSKSDTRALSFLNKSRFSACVSKLLNLRVPVKHFCIIGGGVIGLEMSTYLKAVGSNITILEFSDKIASS